MKINWIIIGLSLLIFSKIKAQEKKSDKDSCVYFYMIQFEGIEHKPFSRDVQNILSEVFRSSPSFQEETKNFIVISKKDINKNDVVELIPNKLLYFKKLNLNKEYNNELEAVVEKNIITENKN